MNNHSVVISGAGLWAPENSITNEELVQSYNQYAEQYNRDNSADIARLAPATN